MNQSTSEGPSGHTHTPSAFSGIRNAKTLKEVMAFLEEENIAAIVEAIRQEKWAPQLIPLYLAHPNHVVRYEIAVSPLTEDCDLQKLSEDHELIVRQGALKNLRAKLLERKLKNQTVSENSIKVKEQSEKAENENDKEKGKEVKAQSNKDPKPSKNSKKEKRKNKKKEKKDE